MQRLKVDKASFKVIETGEGFLKAEISVARPGVFDYYNMGELQKEAKLPEDIFSIDTIKSLEGAVVTDKHPMKNGEYIFVDSDNYNEHVKGSVFNPRIENNVLKADTIIYDKDLIEKIKNKKQNEASIGFSHSLDCNAGYYNNTQYDVAQKNIGINHVALVPWGRAGSDIKIHVDKKEKIMSKWIVDGGDASNLLTYRRFDNTTDIQVDGEIHGELMGIKNELKEKTKSFDSLEKENQELKDQVEKLKVDTKEIPEKKELLTQLETANDKADEWKKKYDKLEGSIPEMVDEFSKSRVDLIDFAKSVDSEMKVDGLTNKEIKLQIIAKGLPFKSGIKVDSQTDEIVEARFDAACELLRVKATEIDNKKVSRIKIDKSQIEEKRKSLVNVYERTLEGGK